MGSSLALVAEQRGVDGLRGRERAAATWLPSNPVASFSLARRQAPVGGTEVVNWQATLGQEIEIPASEGSVAKPPATSAPRKSSARS